MGRKSVLEPYDIITSGDLSGNITSAETTVKNLDAFSFETSWTGVGVDGVLVVEGFKKQGWQEIPVGTVTMVGTSGADTIAVLENTWQKVRVRFVRTSGMGTLNICINGLVWGA